MPAVVNTYSESGRGGPDTCSFVVEYGGLINVAAANQTMGRRGLEVEVLVVGIRKKRGHRGKGHDGLPGVNICYRRKRHLLLAEFIPFDLGGVL